jgi:hypothetical protein
LLAIFISTLAELEPERRAPWKTREKRKVASDEEWGERKRTGKGRAVGGRLRVAIAKSREGVAQVRWSEGVARGNANELHERR